MFTFIKNKPLSLMDHGLFAQKKIRKWISQRQKKNGI